LLRVEVLKREALEGDKAVAAEKIVRRAARRRARARNERALEGDVTQPETISASKQEP
jgi:hypothetical protein